MKIKLNKIGTRPRNYDAVVWFPELEETFPVGKVINAKEELKVSHAYYRIEYRNGDRAYAMSLKEVRRIIENDIIVTLERARKAGDF